MPYVKDVYEGRGNQVIVSCNATSAASDGRIFAEVGDLLKKRTALSNPPITLTISNAVARGIAALFSSATPSGQVLEQFSRRGAMDSDQLVESARTEQDYASPEGHAALHCLIGWVHGQVHSHSVLTPAR
jgi:hypothetical protein